MIPNPVLGSSSKFILNNLFKCFWTFQARKTGLEKENYVNILKSRRKHANIF